MSQYYEENTYYLTSVVLQVSKKVSVSRSLNTSAPRVRRLSTFPNYTVKVSDQDRSNTTFHQNRTPVVPRSLRSDYGKPSVCGRTLPWCLRNPPSAQGLHIRRRSLLHRRRPLGVRSTERPVTLHPSLRTSFGTRDGRDLSGCRNSKEVRLRLGLLHR